MPRTSFQPWVLAGLWLGAVAGCAAAPPAVGPQSGFPGSCAFVRMEYMEEERDTLPVHSTSVMLVYRPPSEHAGPEASPISAKIQVRQERVNDLRARLEAHPELVCQPDPAAPGGYRISLP